MTDFTVYLNELVHMVRTKYVLTCTSNTKLHGTGLVQLVQLVRFLKQKCTCTKYAFTSNYVPSTYQVYQVRTNINFSIVHMVRTKYVLSVPTVL